MGFSRQEYWSGYQGNLPDPGTEAASLVHWQAESLPLVPLGTAAAAAKSLQSCPTLATPRTVARQAPLSIGFFRQEYWSGLPFPSPGDLPDSGIQPRSPALQADSLLTELPGSRLHRLAPAKT